MLQQAQTNSQQWKVGVIIGVSVLGMALALVSTQQTVRIQNFDLESPLLCGLSGVVNCNAAQASSYALFAGVPVAWWGFLHYLWTAFAAIVALKWPDRSRSVLTVAFMLSVSAVGISLYKAYILAFVLRVLCPFCVLMYLANFALLFLLKHVLGISFRGIPAVLARAFSRSLASLVSVVVIFVIGFGAFKVYADSLNKLDLDVAQEIENHFRQPVVSIETDDSLPMRGTPDAAVTIVDFSDFQCPTCRTAAFQLHDLLWEFRDDIRFYFMHFPLDRKINRRIPRTVHARAGLAARAADCAQELGDFWVLHDDLFRHQENIDLKLILNLVEKRGWDAKAFTLCIFSRETAQRVTADIEEAHRVHVNATPTIFINGRQVRHWYVPEILREIVRREIRVAQRRSEDDSSP